MSLSSTASLVKTSRNTPTESKQIIESTIWVGSVLEAILMIASLELLRCSTPRCALPMLSSCHDVSSFSCSAGRAEAAEVVPVVNAYFGPHGRLPNQGVVSSSDKLSENPERSHSSVA
ncbi:hypothetical protein PGT21_017285 [Puccinia graminis f. sp. tritici]|uniref:Uncharacterized protein n=1 Tax=Puccinia graminis f. sp. tritici TaxID=56615 RepID=A0A5B0QAI0_PUCGR|nr:hypothetical protein PGT21_017285 [Puccinia graminis f. sp. tritici]